MRFLILLVAVASIPLVQPDAAVAEERPNDLILILDASNSMWGQIDGENKVVIARRAVGGLIDGLPDDSRAGLIAYGHRREGDCADIETLAPIAPVDKENLKATINGIKPKGKTPITDSIHAATNLAREREASSIVLISDGLETCDLDPCAAVRTAKQEGVPFVLHVIGFDVAGEDTSQLECAAQAGGGLYMSADSAPQLSEALESAYEKPTVPDGRLVVGATAEGTLQDAAVRVTLASTEEHVAGGRTYASEATNPRSIPLEDGDYHAVVSAIGIKGSPKYEFDFAIVDGSQVEKSFDFSAGELSVGVTRNGELSDASISVRRKGERTDTAGGRTYRRAAHNPKVLKVAAGTYDVTIKSVEMRNGPETLFENVVVHGGERTELSHEFVSGILRVGTRRGDALVDSVVNIIDANGKNIGGGRTYTTPSSNPKEFVLAPGEYVIRIAEIRGQKRETGTTVVAGETADVLIDLDQP